MTGAVLQVTRLSLIHIWGNWASGSWRWLPALFETRHRLLHQFRTATEIPIGIGDMDVAEIGGEERQASLDLHARAVPSQQCLDCKPMPLIPMAELQP